VRIRFLAADRLQSADFGLGEDGVDLGEGLHHALFHAHGENLFQRLPEVRVVEDWSAAFALLTQPMMTL